MRSTTLFAISLILVGCSSAPVDSSMQTYENTAQHFAIDYPADWTVDGSGEPSETRLKAPDSVGLHTNLSSVTVIITATPSCADSAGTEEKIINDKTFHTSTLGEGAAGSLYESWVYSTEMNGACYVSTLVLRSCNLGPDCGTDNTEPFDRAPHVEQFEEMLGTLKTI